MRVFINKVTTVKFEVEDDKAEWFEREADFTEFFEEPELVVIKPKVKRVTVQKSKVSKKVLQANKDK